METLSTAQIPDSERFAAWREVSSKRWVPLEARCDPHLESTFRAQASFSELGPVQVVVLTTTPLSIHRTPTLIRRSDPETFLVTCTVGGRVWGEQDGRNAELHVGDLSLRDSSQPYLTRLAPDGHAAQTVCLQFARSLLPFAQRDLRDLLALRIPGDRGVGALSSQYLLQLARHLHEFSPADTVRLSTLTLDVLTAALAGALDAHSAVPPHRRRRALVAEVHAFILTNLGDAHLSPEAIAAAHHISLRYLHRLFHDDGHTVAGWIRQRRLQRCRRDLADPRLAAHTISSIAARWGFTSPAHFSQAFRSAYGLSPRQFRRQCATVHAD
ncbi:helix-turn-helix domain-containing protein [Planomonospora sp. ID67723]|uniref:helix-turn-helix domain-containing protein n=1 Tax=Planomonospora sp. ID67723 TaxID=2738134 RepID=UPI0018C37612|nr:helix-turn-helix domain-containing protein [Planomonospora sp. ID67723]MBG0829025.1 helix-turn-helix domain-containing protein [Planomonospora sp. ID67723]